MIFACHKSYIYTITCFSYLQFAKKTSNFENVQKWEKSENAFQNFMLTNFLTKILIVTVMLTMPFFTFFTFFPQELKGFFKNGQKINVQKWKI